MDEHRIDAVIECRDGEIMVRELDDGRCELKARPADSKVRPRLSWTTSYPRPLVETIAMVKGAAWTCDEIRRDEERGYIRKNIEQVLAAYPLPSVREPRRILDFGCGCGASTCIIATLFPTAEVVGVDLLDQNLRVARERAAFYGFDNVRFLTSPAGDRLPADIGQFDLVFLSAVFEHLLPGERDVVGKLMGQVTPVGGTLLLFDTPDRRFPIETHTTGLPLVNYLPDGMAFGAARRLSRRVQRTVSDQDLLRAGLRGATPGEIDRCLSASDFRWQRERPAGGGVRQQSQIWYRTATDRLARRPMIRRAAKLVDVLRIPVSPYLSLAYSRLPSRSTPANCGARPK